MTDESDKPQRSARAAPKDGRTTMQRLEGPKPLTMAVERPKAAGFDPYARVGAGVQAGNDPGATSRRDLRKLGEWIKMKRELEERRARGEFNDDQAD